MLHVTSPIDTFQVFRIRAWRVSTPHTSVAGSPERTSIVPLAVAVVAQSLPGITALERPFLPEVPQDSLPSHLAILNVYQLR